MRSGGAADDKNKVGRMSPDCLISNGMVQNLPVLPVTWHRCWHMTQSSSSCSLQYCLRNGSASPKTGRELTKTKTRMRKKGYKTSSINVRFWPFSSNTIQTSDEMRYLRWDKNWIV